VATSLHRIYPTRNDLLFTFYEPLGKPRHIGRRGQMYRFWMAGQKLVAALGLPRCPVGRILGRLFGRLI
jgi:hypothetical protein